MGLATNYHNNYLKPAANNLQQIIYMTAIIVFDLCLEISERGVKNGDIYLFKYFRYV